MRRAGRRRVVISIVSSLLLLRLLRLLVLHRSAAVLTSGRRRSVNVLVTRGTAVPVVVTNCRPASASGGLVAVLTTGRRDVLALAVVLRAAAIAT